MKTLSQLTLYLISMVLIVIVLNSEILSPDVQSGLSIAAGIVLGFALTSTLVDMKSRNRREQLKRIERIKQAIIKAYPEAVDLSYESNNVTHGIYYRLPKAKLRSFRPMSENIVDDNLILYLILSIVLGIIFRIISVIHNEPTLGYIGGTAALITVIGLSLQIFKNIRTIEN